MRMLLLIIAFLLYSEPNAALSHSLEVDILGNEKTCSYYGRYFTLDECFRLSAKLRIDDLGCYTDADLTLLCAPELAKLDKYVAENSCPPNYTKFILLRARSSVDAKYPNRRVANDNKTSFDGDGSCSHSNASDGTTEGD
jgi:hypothetical protein